MSSFSQKIDLRPLFSRGLGRSLQRFGAGREEFDLTPAEGITDARSVDFRASARSTQWLLARRWKSEIGGRLWLCGDLSPSMRFYTWNTSKLDALLTVVEGSLKFAQSENISIWWLSNSSLFEPTSRPTLLEDIRHNIDLFRDYDPSRDFQEIFLEAIRSERIAPSDTIIIFSDNIALIDSLAHIWGHRSMLFVHCIDPFESGFSSKIIPFIGSYVSLFWSSRQQKIRQKAFLQSRVHAQNSASSRGVFFASCMLGQNIGAGIQSALYSR